VHTEFSQVPEGGTLAENLWMRNGTRSVACRSVGASMDQIIAHAPNSVKGREKAMGIEPLKRYPAKIIDEAIRPIDNSHLVWYDGTILKEVAPSFFAP